MKEKNNMFQWIFNDKANKKGENKSGKMKYLSNCDTDLLISNWMSKNNINDLTFEEILYELGLVYDEKLSLNKSPISISHPLWNNPNYIGSIEFVKRISDSKLNNKYTEFIKKAINDDYDYDCDIKHIIHFYKDSIAIDTKYADALYMYKRRNYLLSQVYRINKYENGRIYFVGQEQSYKIVDKSKRSYLREEKDGNIKLELEIKKHPDTEKIVALIDNLQNKRLSNETNLFDELTYKTLSFPAPADILNVILTNMEKEKIKPSKIHINFIKDYKLLWYLDYTKNDVENTMTIITNDKKEGCQKLYINNFVEDDLNCHMITIFIENKRLELKIKGIGQIYVKNEISLINYLLNNFSKKTSIFVDDSIESMFKHISDCSFQEPEDNLISVELYRYKGDRLIDSKIWERHNLLKKYKTTLESSGPKLVKKITPKKN